MSKRVPVSVFGDVILGVSHDAMHVKPGDSGHAEAHENTGYGFVDSFEDWWIGR